MKIIYIYYRAKRRYYKGECIETWKKVNLFDTDYLKQLMESS